MLSNEIDAVIESLRWMSRRQVVDFPTQRLMSIWEQRFRAQGRFFVRRGLPRLFAATEATRDEHARITDSILALDAFTYDRAAVVYNETVPEVVAAGAMQSVRDVGANLQFSNSTDFVLTYLKDHSAERLAADIDATTKKRVRALLVQSYEEHWTRAKVTNEIKGLFDGFAARAPQAGIRNRAELIAVKELGDAYSQGTLKGAVSIEQQTGMVLQKAWALSAGACPVCLPNQGDGWIPLGDNFSSGDDAPTAHPACRCSLMTRVKPAA